MSDRDRFEDWCGDIGMSIERHGEHIESYQNRLTQMAWQAWQAALAAREPPQQGSDSWEGRTDDPLPPLIKTTCSEPETRYN